MSSSRENGGERLGTQYAVRSTQYAPSPTIDHSPLHHSILTSPSRLRAWCFLVLLSWQRQARVRQMVWIALALLAFSVAWVGVTTLMGRWGMNHWRWRAPGEPWIEWSKRA